MDLPDYDVPVKIEKMTLFSLDGIRGIIIVKDKVVYFPIRADIRDKVSDLYDLDLTDKDSYMMTCEVREEKQENCNGEVVISFVLKRRHKSKIRQNRKVQI